MGDIITIKSWGGIRQLERKDAIKFYLECMSICQGAELEHYTHIYLELLGGQTLIYE